MARLGSVQVPLRAYVPSSASAVPATTVISRHSALVRVTHWITTLCFLALLVSGVEIVISHPRFYWGETGNVLTTPLFKLPIPSSRALVPTGYGYVLSDQNGWSRYLHFEAAWTAISQSPALKRSKGLSKSPLANEIPPLNEAFKRLQAGGFADWRLSVNGMVDRTVSLSLAQLKSYPSRSRITQLACEEGWSYIAEWIGVPLSHVLDVVGIHPQARYIVYFSIDPDWWESIDMVDAMHPQTFLAYGMNGNELPVGNGGPLRMRLPRQLGYKSVKYITHLTVTDSLKGFGKGLGSASPEGGYA